MSVPSSDRRNMPLTPEQQAKVDEIYIQLGKLSCEFQQIVNPTEEDIQSAVEMLTDDPYNNIQSVVTWEDSLGQIMILQQILDDREFEEEDEGLLSGF
jgi:chemotaxis signal transduction protein